jgi:hypothetical protein
VFRASFHNAGSRAFHPRTPTEQRAASIANAPSSSSKGGRKSGKGRGGSKSQKRAAGSEEGKKAGSKS